jgi:maleylacetate reductase
VSAAPDFTFIDGERLVRFGTGTVDEAGALLEQRGFGAYTLLTTARAAQVAPAVVDAAAARLDVEPGRVDELAAGLLGEIGDGPLVALGGGRVIDVAKSIGGTPGREAPAAIPTTLAGSPLTPFHRPPKGVDGARLVRPSLAVCDPALMASQPMPALAASAMNAAAHAVESLYTPLANPVAGMAALRALSTFSLALNPEDPDRGPLAYAAVLAGYAVGTTGFSIHHATCQTIVRELGTPHAETNAVMLPRSIAFMADRAPIEVGLITMALGDPGGDPALASALMSRLAELAGPTTLAEVGVARDALLALAEPLAGHPALANTPGGTPGLDDVRGLLESAL